MNGEIVSRAWKFSGTQTEDKTPALINLDEVADFVFLRQDPPFNISYITTTYLLERLQRAKVLNNPKYVRDCPEKLFVLDFAEYMPETIITTSESDIREFWKKHGEIILKPLYACAGMGVFYIPENDKNLFNATRILKQNYENLPIIAQKYVKNVTKGDKRILFIDGKVVGAINRIQATDYAISNTAVGGKYIKTELTATEQKLCAKLGLILKEKELFLVGIDVIDDMITEINVTSPTGYLFLNELENIRCQDIMIQKLLEMK